LAPINIVTKLGIQSHDIERQHPVRAQLAQPPRVTGLERLAIDCAVKIGRRLFQSLLVHLEIEKKSVEVIAAHSASGAILNCEL
jgi:hypothetical protein